MLDYLEQSGQLDNTSIMADLRQRRQRRRRSERHVQRVGVLQRCAVDRRADAAAHRRARHAGVEQPLPHRLGVGARHAVPVLEAVGRLRGRRFRHVRRRRGRSRSKRRTTVRQQYVHAVDVVPTIYDLLGDRTARDDQGLSAEPDRRRELRGRAHRQLGAPGRRRSSTRCSDNARSTTTVGSRARCILRSPGWGKFEDDDLGALPPRASIGRRAHDLAAEQPARLETMKSLWFYYAGIYNGLPLDDRTALEQVLSDRPRPAPPRDQYVFYPNCADVPEVCGSGDLRAFVHDLGRRAGRAARRRGCALGRGWCRRRSLALRQGQEAALHVQLDRQRLPGRRRRAGHHDRPPRLHRRFRGLRPEHGPGDARVRRDRDALRRRGQGR